MLERIKEVCYDPTFISKANARVPHIALTASTVLSETLGDDILPTDLTWPYFTTHASQENRIIDHQTPFGVQEDVVVLTSHDLLKIALKLHMDNPYMQPRILVEESADLMAAAILSLAVPLGSKDSTNICKQISVATDHWTQITP